MNQFLGLIEELDQGLLKIESSENTRIIKSTLKIKHCEGMITKLKAEFLRIPELSREDEIRFFKLIKPKFTAELHFQMAIFQYYKGMPKGTPKEKKKYINQNMEKVSSYLKDYNEFNVYMKTGSEHMDCHYFRQIEFDLRIHSALEHPLDREFTSPASPTLTCIICAERFIQFLKNELHTLINPKLDPSWDFKQSLPWNGSKTDLIELIYALHASGSIEGELKDTFSRFECLFNIELGNFYRVYTDIKLKKTPTAFINDLKTSLLDKISQENQ